MEVFNILVKHSSSITAFRGLWLIMDHAVTVSHWIVMLWLSLQLAYCTMLKEHCGSNWWVTQYLQTG